jgi:hypothetical protein
MKPQLRLAAVLAPALLALSACAVAPAQGLPDGSARASAPLRLVVNGSTLGYTNRDSTQLVSSCFKDLPLPAGAKIGSWAIYFDFHTAFMGQFPVDEIRATLTQRGRVVASLSTRAVAADEASHDQFCDAIIGLTQRTWSAVATSGEATAAVTDPHARVLTTYAPCRGAVQTENAFLRCQ